MRIYTKTYGMCLKLYLGKSVTLKNFTVKKRKNEYKRKQI